MATINNVYTLKVNIRAQEEKERRVKERNAKEAISKIQAISGPPPRQRKRKGLNFYEPGTFVAQGEQLRKRAKLEALQKKIAAKAAKTGITDAAKLASLTTSKSDKSSKDAVQEIPVPLAEWWDEVLVGKQDYKNVVLKLQQDNPDYKAIFTTITDLIEHPPCKKPEEEVELPIFPTKKEQKQLRRYNNRIKQEEDRQKMRLGLKPKPEPKLSKSNIMYALGDVAIVNPSMAEQLVREQEEKRKQAHIDHNESMKLTDEERRAKKLRKVQEDLSVTGIWVAVYRILNLSSQSNKFKITQNAKQLTMSGVLMLYKDINLVIVEGGPKQQRKFKHLMMDRIQWKNDTTTTASSTATNSTDTTNPVEGITDQVVNNKCYLVWEGRVNSKAFKWFKVKTITTEEEARQMLTSVGIEHYWDLAFNMSILETID